MNKLEPKVTITLDDLALMVKQGFKEVDDNFVKIKSYITGIESGMATKTDIKRLEDRFIAVEKTVYDDHHPRLRKIEKKLQIV